MSVRVPSLSGATVESKPGCIQNAFSRSSTTPAFGSRTKLGTRAQSVVPLMFSNLVLILTLILASNYARALPQGANLDRLAGDDVIQQDWSDLQYGRFDENELRKRQFWPFCTTATTTITVTVGQAGVVSSTSMTTSIKSTSSSKARTSPTYVPSPSVVPVGTPVRLTTGSSAVASTTTKPVTTTVLWVRPRTFTRFNPWGQVTATVVSTVTDLVTVTTTAYVLEEIALRFVSD